MTEKFDVSVPWGVAAVSATVGDKAEAEIVLLQQSIIDSQLKDLAAVNTKLNVTRNFCIQLETDKSSAEHRVMELESELYLAQGRINTLETQEVSDPAELAELRVRVLELEAALELATQAKKEVLERNYDQERKLEAAGHQKDTTQRLFDEQRQELIKLRSVNESLEISNEALTVEIKDANKYIKQVEDELAGVAARIENAVAAERARCEEAHSKEIAELRSQLKGAEAQQSEVKAVSIEHNTERQKLHSEIRRLQEHADQMLAVAEDANKALLDSTQAQKESCDLMDVTLASFEFLKGEHAKQADQLDEVKRNNLYLQQILDYRHLKDVWSHQDGTFMYMLCDAPESMFEVVESFGVNPSKRHPLCWVMNPNGTGHTVMLSEDETELLFPNAVTTDTMLKEEHREAVTKALTGFTTKGFNAALDEAIQRSMNIVDAASLLDVDWCAGYTASKVISEAIRTGACPDRLAKQRAGLKSVMLLARRHEAIIAQSTKKLGAKKKPGRKKKR